MSEISAPNAASQLASIAAQLGQAGPRLAQFDGDAVSALAPDSRATFEKNLRDAGYSQAEIDARLPAKPIPAEPDTRTQRERAFDGSKLAPPSDTTGYELQTGGDAAVHAEWSTALHSMGIPAMLGQSAMDLAEQASRDVSRMSEWDRDNWIAEQDRLVNSVSKGKNESVKQLVDAALEGLKASSPKLYERLERSGALHSAQLRMLLAGNTARTWARANRFKLPAK